MLTDYERYQLEWMIDHGHSLGELMSSISLLQKDYEVAADYNKTVEELFDIWGRDSGFGGEIFVSEEEYATEDAPALTATESKPVSYQQAKNTLIQDIMRFKNEDAAAAVELVAETLGEAIRREGGETLRDWYKQTYPEDPLGSKINPVITFDDALSAVPTGGGFYDFIGTADSVVRERIFEELCSRYGYSYDDIYDSWLYGKPLNADPDRALQRMRREAGYRSAADFAIAAGLSIPAYQSYERGAFVPPEAIVIVTRTLAASGVQMDAWFAENGNRKPTWLTARTAPQQPEKVAVAAGHRFNLVDARDASGLDLDAEARAARGVAHGLAPRQPDTPEHAARGR